MMTSRSTRRIIISSIISNSINSRRSSLDERSCRRNIGRGKAASQILPYKITTTLQRRHHHLPAPRRRHLLRSPCTRPRWACPPTRRGFPPTPASLPQRSPSLASALACQATTATTAAAARQALVQPASAPTQVRTTAGHQRHRQGLRWHG